MRACWCGAGQLLSFSPEYAECSACGTLVSQQSLSDEQLRVQDDETDFYGKQYWLGHQQQDLGFPDIYARARNDLTERNLHWLKALLKYRLPPAKVLELGCSQGSFVALMRQAGYDASGVEMSPWVVEFGQKTFTAPIYVGPVESLDIPEASLDVIALMDVLEHLPDPVSTMAHCLKLLKPEGLLLIQTPQFRNVMDYHELLETKGAFLDQLKADEHLYLFSESSATHLFQQLGAEHIQFEPAIFSVYDMFFAVSRAPLRANTSEQIESTLLANVNGRMTLALMDLRERELSLIRKWELSESDRAARAEQIAKLTAMLKVSESDRAARAEQITKLTAMLKVSEPDRAARGEQIAKLTAMLKVSESDRAEQFAKLTARDEQIASLLADVRTLFAHRVMRWLLRFSNWPELGKLSEQIKKKDE